MPSLCQNLKVCYEHLEKLTTEFLLEYNAVKETGDLTRIKVLRKNLEKAREALLEHLPYFIVSDACNPYHEALLEAGLDESQTQEREEMTLDIRKEIKRQLAVYREVKDKKNRPLLEEWFRDITEKEDLINLSPNNHRQTISPNLIGLDGLSKMKVPKTSTDDIHPVVHIQQPVPIDVTGSF